MAIVIYCKRNRNKYRKKMGNLQTILESMSDSQKIEFLRKEGMLCDELLRLYYEGNASSREIHDYVFSAVRNTKFNKDL